MTTWAMFLLIAGCAVVTWVPRVVPFMFVKNVQLPDVVLRWLKYIPVCILSALVFESLFHEGEKLVVPDWESIAAFVPTLIVALVTKSLSGTVIVGVISMAFIRFVAGA
ncbi:MAG: AzlD domain-containing protein [Lysinibacillus sp.]